MQPVPYGGNQCCSKLVRLSMQTNILVKYLRARTVPSKFNTWPNIIKLFCQLFTNFRKKLVFVPGKLFQPSLENTLAYC
jgi:hypothetical protein